jgi:hypothetical protein
VTRQIHPADHDEPIELMIGDDSVPLGVEELDRLVTALAEIEEGDASRVADDIAALRLAGGSIHLMPTVPELDAIRIALAAEGAREPLSEGLAHVAELCDAVPDRQR